MGDPQGSALATGPSASPPRRTRAVIGVVVAALLLAAYVFAVVSYGASVESTAPSQSAPPGGVGVVLATEQVWPGDQEATGYVLLFPDAGLLDVEGALTTDVVVDVRPSIGEGSFRFAKGEAPTPQRITLPAPGVEQRYPFDTYDLAARVRAAAVIGGATEATPVERDLPVSASLLFRAPGWGLSADEIPPAAQVTTVSGTINRSGSTKSIAIMLLVLMIVLATIAVLVVISTNRGRLALELSVASWITAMLFALLPIRGFFPGGPPIGSWIDILVFFWVEAVLMVCVTVTATALLLRANRSRSATVATSDG